MTKSQMIAAIENAKEVHLMQMNKIKLEIAGKNIKNPTALGKMECECGVWFYENEKIMKNILGLQLFEHLDRDHEKWHADYINIYNLFFKEEKKGIFSKILGKKHNEMTIDKAKLYYTQLEKDTKALFLTADSAIRRVSALSESKFS
ncbi:MAG: CZB domain-containing protein [Campylobacterota bacterium]|nr:CZB domain-containing protein [Campylobacterota bacterium]